MNRKDRARCKTCGQEVKHTPNWEAVSDSAERSATTSPVNSQTYANNAKEARMLRESKGWSHTGMGATLDNVHHVTEPHDNRSPEHEAELHQKWKEGLPKSALSGAQGWYDAIAAAQAKKAAENPPEEPKS